MNEMTEARRDTRPEAAAPSPPLALRVVRALAEFARDDALAAGGAAGADDDALPSIRTNFPTALEYCARSC